MNIGTGPDPSTPEDTGHTRSAHHSLRPQTTGHDTYFSQHSGYRVEGDNSTCFTSQPALICSGLIPRLLTPHLYRL